MPLNSKLSAYAALEGQDFNKTPLAPPGIKVIVHQKPSWQGTYIPHGINGWYIGLHYNTTIVSNSTFPLPMV
jgi:hypothetical protein